MVDRTAFNIDPDAHLTSVIGFEEPKMYLYRRLKGYYERKADWIAAKRYPSKGIILFGLPGVGKTYLISAVLNDFIGANNKDMFWVSVELSRLVSDRVGQSSEKIHEFFDTIKFTCQTEKKDCVLVMDEIEVVAPKRGKTKSVMTQERTHQILKELDGVNAIQNIFVLGTTNRPWDIDPAMLRSGRIEAMFKIDPPNKDQRIKLLEKYLTGITLDAKVDFSIMAEHTEHFTGADFKQLGNNLFEMWLSTNKVPITSMDVTSAIGKIKNWSNYFVHKKHVDNFDHSANRGKKDDDTD